MSDKKELEVISGDGSNLDISPVYEHLNAAKPKGSSEKPKDIVIPCVKSSKNEKKDKKEKDENKSENNHSDKTE